MTMVDRNGASTLCWTRAYLIGDYLSNLIRDRDSRPPNSEGVFLVSERPWDEMPSKFSGIVYVGQSESLRRRIGQLLCDLYDHHSDHFLWHHCCTARGLEPSRLYLGWGAPCRCPDCAEVKLRELMETPWNLWPARSCEHHTPALELIHNFSISVDPSAISKR